MITMSFYDKTIWPIKTAKEGNAFCGKFFIRSNKKPWAMFETFSEHPTLHRLDLKHKYSDRQIERTIVGDSEFNLLEILNNEMRIIAIETLLKRFQECQKNARRYDTSRYWESHMKEAIGSSYATQAHIDLINKNSQWGLLDPLAMIQKIQAEPGDVAPVSIPEGLNLSPRLQDQKMKLTPHAIVDRLRQAAAEGTAIVKAPEPFKEPEEPVHNPLVFEEQQGVFYTARPKPYPAYWDMAPWNQLDPGQMEYLQKVFNGGDMTPIGVKMHEIKFVFSRKGLEMNIPWEDLHITLDSSE